MSPKAKTVLITGGGRGIGRSTAILCGARGWNIGVNYAADAKAAEETVAAVAEAGGNAIAIAGDVREEADVAAMFDVTIAAFGMLDGVVNNAGIVAPGSRLADMATDRIRRIVDVNVMGALFVAREAAQRMGQSRGGQGGAIVNVSSMAARLGSPGEYVDYAASKGAIDTLTIGLSKELAGDGIRVNAVRPGLIETDIHASGGAPDRARRLGVQTPLGRAGKPQEVAEAIVWLLSDASSYTTGALIDISGGR